MVINSILSYSDHQIMVLELLKGVRKASTEPELHKKRFQLIHKFEDGIPVSEKSSEQQTRTVYPNTQKIKVALAKWETPSIAPVEKRQHKRVK